MTSPRFSCSDDILACLDQVDHSLLDCNKLTEKTLNYDDATEYNTPEARFNYNLDEFMYGLDHPNPFDDLEQWSNNIHEFMEELCKPTPDPFREY